MPWIVELLASLLLLVGSFFTIVGSVGLVRLGDVFMRLHAPTKASTLGIGGLLIASVIVFTATRPGVSLHEILIFLFLFMTAPISAHLMAKAAIYMRLRTLAPERPSTEAKEPEPQFSLDGGRVMTLADLDTTEEPHR